jgi:DNA-binding GntR family transcriptional regulator
MTIITESLTSIEYVPGAHSGLPAALPTKRESRHLQTSPSTPALEVLSVGFLDSNVPARGKRR